MQTHFQAYEVHIDGFYPDEDLIPDMWQYEKDHYPTDKERPAWLLVLFILILILKNIIKSVHTVWADILVVALKYFTVSSN